MTENPLTPAMRQALTAMLAGPLTRGRHVSMGDGWLDQKKNFHAQVVVRNLYRRRFVLPPTNLAVLSIAGRKEAQRVQAEAA
jgi:hypothetical protein